MTESINHASRAHATLSPSSAARWLTCTAAPGLEAQMPDNNSSVYAEEGTLAHEIAEVQLRSYFDGGFSAKKKAAELKKFKADKLYQDEMMTHTETYLDIVKQLYMQFKEDPFIQIEQKFPLDSITGEIGSVGTTDCILIGNSCLTVIDFKYGKGCPVTAEKNPQMMIYALAALDFYSMIYQIETVKTVIVQPRLSADPSVYTLTAEELRAFGREVWAKSRLILDGKGEFKPSAAACRFCRAGAVCKARAKYNTEMAFKVSTSPDTIGLDEIGMYLKKGEDIQAWLGTVSNYAMAQIIQGNEVKGYKVVEGRGSRDWADVEKAFEHLKELGTDEALLYERTALSVAKAEKLLGKKNFETAAGEYVINRQGRPTLVPDTDKRPAITTKVSAAEAFKN